MRVLRILVLAASLAITAGAHAQSAQSPAPAGAPAGDTAQPTAKDPVSARREYELALQLRCLVCQNQSIAESNADLAVDLRRQVREQIAAGRSDAQIVDYMTARYGDFVLYKPPVKGITLLLWVGPFALLLVGAFVAWRIVRARRTEPAPAPLTDEERGRAEQLLQGEGGRQ